METAFTNGRVFLGNGRVLENATVVVADDTIKEVLTTDASLPRETERIPIKDRTLFPGFIDCHVHLCMDASPDPMGGVRAEPSAMTTIKAVEHARKTLACGVTTVRDLGGRDGIDLTLKAAVDQGLVPGPRILASGRLVCMTGRSPEGRPGADQGRGGPAQVHGYGRRADKRGRTRQCPTYLRGDESRNRRGP